MNWPSKNDRENYEIEGFIESYKRLSHGRNFVIEIEGEKPDRIVRDTDTNEKFGVELTSVYLDDRSVPDFHMKEENISVPFELDQIKLYEKRILEKIVEKVYKAKRFYKRDFPLILSVYVNEYISVRMGIDYWRTFASRYYILFDCFAPFEEIVFWPLPSPQGEPDLVISAKVKGQRLHI